MSTMLCTTTDAELSSCESSPRDAYATAPMVAVMPTFQPLDEEVLYTSFEEAISDRVIALHGRLSRITSAYMQKRTDPARRVASSALSEQKKDRRVSGGWHLGMIFSCLALICVLLGFDVMGLLVLYLH